MIVGDHEAAWQRIAQRLSFIERQEANQRTTGDHADILMSGLWLARHLEQEDEYRRVEAVLESAVARLLADGPLADDPAVAISMAMVRADIDTARQWLPVLQPGRWVYFDTMLKTHPIFMPLAATDEGVEFFAAVQQLRQQQSSRLHDEAPSWLFQPEQLQVVDADQYGIGES